MVAFNKICDDDDRTIEGGCDLGNYKVFPRLRSGHKWVSRLAKDKSGKKWSFKYPDKDKILTYHKKLAAHRGTPLEKIEAEAERDFLAYQEMLKEIAERSQGLSHEHVCMVKGWAYLPEERNLVFISEYAPGIELFYAASELDPISSVLLYARALEGLSFIHSNGLLHLNVKPSRIYINLEGDETTVKFTDYGFAIPIQGYEGEYGYTPSYAASEVIQGQRDRIGESSDLFSFGIGWYECLTRHLPLGDRDIAGGDKNYLKQIVEREESVSSPPSHYNTGVPPEMDQLVLDLLEKDSNKRKYRYAEDVLAFIYEKWPEESKKLKETSTTTMEWQK